MKKYIIKEIYNDDNYIYFNNLKDDIENFDNENIFLLENRDNGGINDTLIKTLINDIFNYSDYVIEYYYKNHYVNYIIDTLKPYKKLSLKQAINIMLLCKDNNIKENDFIIKALSIIYAAQYKLTCLRGYSQSDWIYCFYNSDKISFEYIQEIEAILFNTGIEVYISFDKTEIDDINDIDNYDYDGYYEYIVNYFLISDKIKKLCDIIGCQESDIIYYGIENVYTYTVVKHEIKYKEMKE